MNSAILMNISVDLLRDTIAIHYDDVTMGTIASLITSLTIVYATVYTDVDQRKHQSSASLAFVWGIHRRPVNSPHKWPVTRKMFPFDDVIVCQMMELSNWQITRYNLNNIDNGDKYNCYVDIQ